jgi:hypothetical protein
LLRAAKKKITKTVHPKSAQKHTSTDLSFLRPENEDDDGYDPFSDRPPSKEPLFSKDPWA